MENLRELYKQSRSTQDKFTYFLLAVSASAIAFSVQQVSDRTFGYSLIPLGVALLLWGISFYCGCLNIKYVCSNIYANFELVKIEAGQSDQVPNHPQYREAATEGIKSAVESNSNKINRYANLQFKILILGAIFYIVWQFVEMWLRSVWLWANYLKN